MCVCVCVLCCACIILVCRVYLLALICTVPSFCFQIFTKMVAFGLAFFTRKFEVFDATVVLLSWILDIASQ